MKKDELRKRGLRPGFFAFGAHKELADDSTIEVVTTAGANKNKIRVKDGGLSAAKLASSAVTEAKLGSAVVAGLTVGAVAAKVLATTQLEALLSGGAQATAIAMNAGDCILDIILYVGTAAGSACTLDIGLDATAAVGSADPNGLVEAANCNAVSIYRTVDTVTDATEPTYVGDLIGDGPVTIAADGYITLVSSTDQSSSNFVGQLVVLYIPA